MYLTDRWGMDPGNLHNLVEALTGLDAVLEQPERGKWDNISHFRTTHNTGVGGSQD